MSANKKTSVEATLAELEKLVEQMESGELSLEDSLAAFEKGIKLTSESQKALKAAEEKVQRLLAESQEGAPSQEVLDADTLF
ncbi:MAG TPA: exodeoxyribonuclease VII small subunit [Alcanivoracaceae bacterium]|nr:exodeoxyribonuclease VII small subunit [Alcanivoracaceae bacterium]